MNDITALAQKEKFEAWAHSQKLSLAYGDCGYAFSSTEMAWRAWMASSYALVEALEARDKQIAEMSTICAETYQVVGALADAAGVFESSEDVSKVLDNLSLERLMHTDVIPFAVESRTVTVKLADDRAAESEISGYDGTEFYRSGWNARGKADRDALAAAGIQVIEGEG